ncbi:T9SS type A sorting domain-containing protein, partial [bacterium]|nr:T9SS type A sorting domain-containing protein [bacterium]
MEIDGWQTIAPWMGGTNSCTIKYCDIDSDQDLDLFVGALGGGGPVSYLINLGTTTQPDLSWVTYHLDSLQTLNAALNSDPDFKDMDADGDLDAIIGAGYVTYVENFGTPESPSFTASRDTVYTAEYVVIGTRLTLVDIDLDDDVDIISGFNDSLMLYLNVGTPDSFAFELIDSNWQGVMVDEGADPVLCDIDADGDFDLFVGDETGMIHFYQNLGDSANYNLVFVTSSYNNIDVGESSSPEFADIDGDGDYDLFVGRDDIDNAVYSPGDIYFYENIGTPEVAQWQLITLNYLSLDEGNEAYNNSVDINSDLDADVFLGNHGNTISYFENIGSSVNASFSRITGTFQNIYVNGCVPFFIDIDNDMDPDLFAGEGVIPNPPYPGLHLYRNVGTPQTALYNLVTENLIPWSYHAAIKPSLADIDTDGDNDVFISDNNGTFYFAENIGSPDFPEFAAPVLNWQGIDTYAGRPSIFYDIDGDLDLDLFIPGLNLNEISFYRNTGTPSSPLMVLETNEFLVFNNGEFAPLGIDIFDIDQDGDGDFFLGINNCGGLLFFRNTTGDTAAVQPRLQLDPLHGIEFSIGPNPANPITWISYNLPYPQKAEIAVYNLLGQKVATLASGLQMPGQKTLIWDAANYSSGVYWVRIATSGMSGEAPPTYGIKK